MRRIISISALLLCVLSVAAQANMQLHIQLAEGAAFTDKGDRTYEIPASQVTKLAFVAKPIPGNPEHVKLVNTSSIEWSTINYGATSPEDEGTKLAWSADDVVFNNWTMPDQENRKWRMPTVDDLEELIYFCDWEPSDDGKGYWVYNRDDHEKRIYLPSTVNYWSSSQDGNKAEALLFSNGPQQLSTNQLSQYAIRPVWDTTK